MKAQKIFKSLSAVSNDSMYLKVINSYQQNKIEECFDLIEELIKYYPKDSRAWNIKALIYAIKEKKENAINCIKNAIFLEPKSYKYIYNYGNILLQFHNYSEALDKYNLSLKIKEDYTESILNKGVALMRLHRNSEALSNFNRVLKYNKNIPDVYVNIGSITKQML